MRFVYLHGFASTPGSRKAQYFQKEFQKHGLHLEIPTLDEDDFAHLTMSRQVALVEMLLRGEPTHLIGSSMGGYLAALYAAKHKEVGRLILLAPAFGFATRWKQITPPQTFDSWQNTGWMDVYHYGAQALRKISYELYTDALQHPENPDFRQPALIFHGTQDTVVPIDLSETFAASHPNAKLIPLNSGHELTDVLDLIALQALPFLLEPDVATQMLPSLA